MSLFNILVIVMLSTALLCFIVSEISLNYSQVDKLWSIMPVVYSGITLVYFPFPRVWIMTIIVAAWGLRLSYNFYRKGGYNIIPWKGEEDYRWAVMRAHPDLKGRFRFGVFNLLFISLYQHFLILLFCTPLLLVAGNPDSRLSLIDSIASALMILFLILESVADNQRFLFHNLKNGKVKKEGLYKKSLKDGFLSEGLWGIIRHPNYVGEQMFWVSFYLFGVSASGKWLNWTIAGPVLLILLFAGSTALTEKLSSEKYPGYSLYKSKVPKFFPIVSDRFRKK